MRRGFTVIELLVVIAILGILIGLLAPALARARTTSKDLVCQTNVHQIGTLLLDQAWETDRTSRSAYDFTRPRFKALASLDDLGFNGLDNEENEPPRGTRGFGQRLHTDELTSPAQPPSWKLPCPNAIPLEQQSFGMNWRMRTVKPERLNDRDPVLADSAYRIIARGRDIAPRHDTQQATFWFGDGHVEQADESIIPEDDLTRQLRRAQPMPARYPR